MEALVREEPGLAVILGVFRDAKNADAIQAAIADERSASSRSRARRPRSCRHAKSAVQAQFVFAIENENGLAEAIGRSWILTGSPSLFAGDLDEIAKVSAAGTSSAVCKTYFAPEKATVLVVPVKQLRRLPSWASRLQPDPLAKALLPPAKLLPAEVPTLPGEGAEHTAKPPPMPPKKINDDPWATAKLLPNAQPVPQPALVTPGGRQLEARQRPDRVRRRESPAAGDRDAARRPRRSHAGAARASACPRSPPI